MSTIAAPSPVATALHEIDALAKKYASERAIVAHRVDVLEKRREELNNSLLPGIKTAYVAASGAQAALIGAIQRNADLFVKPRTITLHGIKVGFQKGKGSIDWIDDEKLAEKIRDMLPEQFAVLVKTSNKPIKKALQSLDVKTLRKLGCTVEETGDYVFVKAADSDVDKLIARVLKEGAVEEAEG